MTPRLKHLNRLASLLEEERAAVYVTDLDRLEKITPRKLRLLDRLGAEAAKPGCPEEERALARVQRLALRNAKLIEAALDGLRDVQALLDRARRPTPQTTYGRDGTREAIGRPPGQLDERA
jgi:flagellar biosynthesis/type III secretory pathway chaperone